MQIENNFKIEQQKSILLAYNHLNMFNPQIYNET